MLSFWRGSFRSPAFHPRGEKSHADHCNLTPMKSKPRTRASGATSASVRLARATMLASTLASHRGALGYQLFGFLGQLLGLRQQV